MILRHPVLKLYPKLIKACPGIIVPGGSNSQIWEPLQMDWGHCFDPSKQFGWAGGNEDPSPVC